MYLANLGPYQPRLAAYPVNHEIKTGKQNKLYMINSWYDEYPHLEYSVHKDAAFCFVCSLFPIGTGRQSADDAWTVTGVRKWHKMKSTGTKKKGKLQQHFACQSHRGALQDFAHFINPSNQVDTLLDKSGRMNLIQDQSDAAYNKQIVVILFDIVRVLVVQGIPFRGHEDNKSNFLKIVHLVSRYCSPLKHWLDNTKAQASPCYVYELRDAE